MPSDACVEYWGEFTIYPDYVLPALLGISIIMTLGALCIYIGAFVRGTLNAPIALFVAALLLYLAILTWSLNTAFLYSIWCRDVATAHLLRSLHGSLVIYSVQAQLVAINLFLRLIYIFNDTAFSLSKAKICLFWTLNISGTLTYGMGITLGFATSYQLLAVLFLGVSAIIYIFGVIWLNVLLIYKLVMLSKRSASRQSAGCDLQSNDLLHVATKTSLLCFLSTWTSIFSAIAWNVSDYIHSPHFRFCLQVILLLDIWFNYLSILLTFKYFGSIYDRLFGCCHSRCSVLVTHCVKSKKPRLSLEMVAQHVSASASSKSNT